MSSLATAATAARATQDDSENKVRDDSRASHESPKSKNSDQAMETDGSDKLGKHLDTLIDDMDTDDVPQDKEISFGVSQSFFRPPSFARAFVAQDLRTPDLPHIFWASIRIPVLLAPSNATNAMFDTFDDFLTKMKEVDHRFTVFPTTSPNMGH